MATAKSGPKLPAATGGKMVLGFGLVTFPVAMRPLAETTRPVPGKTLCPDHMQPISTKQVCGLGEEHEHEVPRGGAVKGYEVPSNPGTFVVVEDAVLEEIEEEKTGEAKIERIVDVRQVDPLYYERTYLLWPQPGAERAFDLLAEYCRTQGKAAVVTTVLSKQTSTLILRWSPELGAMLVHKVAFTERLRWTDVQLVRAASEDRKVDPKELAMATQLFDSLEGEFEPAEVADAYTPLLIDAIEAAAAKKPRKVTATKKAAPAAESNLMDALIASVGDQPKAATSRRKKVAA